MARQEKEPGHEKPIDHNFRIPSVEGMGAGDGFQLKDLSLPRNYKSLIRALDPKIDIPKFLPKEFERDCRHFSLPYGFIEFKGKLLSQIVFGGLGYSSRVFLDENRLDYETDTKAYRFESVGNIESALVLAKTVCTYLNVLQYCSKQNPQYSYVNYFNNGSRDAYFSENLKIPDYLAEKAKKTDNQSFKDSFALEASNIAGRFGLTVRNLHFENQFLRWFDINEGDACDYGIDLESIMDNSYSPHNVDSPRQAMTLHGIGAAYINRLLARRDMRA
jgi:hypothetical protein